MKVVLFCGGLGTRLREHSDTIPKPLVNIGNRPILWHLMRYYAHFGHKEFILCLGYRGDLIREYFLNYREELTNDFTLRLGRANKPPVLHSRDSEDWSVTFIDTGMHSNIGQRLLRAREYLRGESAFLANYADGLSNVPIQQQIEDFERSAVIASFAAVRNAQSLHAVHASEDGLVTRIGELSREPFWINGGFFVLKQAIFDYIREGDELVVEPFQRLIEQRQLAAFRWPGFWQCMDTLKDKISFDRMEAQGKCPWMLWRPHPATPRS